MDNKITLILKENGKPYLCCQVNGEETKIDLTENEELELHLKINDIILSKLAPEVAHKRMYEFLKFVESSCVLKG
jgi:hypothetical protein